MLGRLDRIFNIKKIKNFLDHRIIEFVMSLPPNMRSNLWKQKKPLFEIDRRMIINFK